MRTTTTLPCPTESPRVDNYTRIDSNYTRIDNSTAPSYDQPIVNATYGNVYGAYGDPIVNNVSPNASTATEPAPVSAFYGRDGGLAGTTSIETSTSDNNLLTAILTTLSIISAFLFSI
jgi:hypothetical protein